MTVSCEKRLRSANHILHYIHDISQARFAGYCQVPPKSCHQVAPKRLVAGFLIRIFNSLSFARPLIVRKFLLIFE